MKVSLIDFTGAHAPDPGQYAARLLVFLKNTRLTQGEDTRHAIFNEWGASKIAEELDYASKTIRSSWEFIDYTFSIQGVTRAFTHQLVRTRTASYAQQAQRVVSMEDFEALMPATVAADANAEFTWNHVMAAIAAGYQDLQGRGIPTQDCRGVLPTNVLTNICMKVNLRTFADLVGKRENLRAQGEYADVVRAMLAEVRSVHPWVEPFVHPERTATPALDELLARELGSAGPLDKPRLNEALKELDGLKGTWG